MENMPLISVIVPVYKVEAYLDKCIFSIVGQSYQNLEIILVDDGSPDRCPAMCDAWLKKDPRIKVVHKKNGGLSDARNAGLAVASGAYIGFIDSDDWIEKDFYQNLLTAMIDHQCDIATCGIDPFHEEDAGGIPADEYTTACYHTEEALSLLIDDQIRQVVWNKLYRREVIEGILFAKGKCNEDEFWSYQVIGNSKKVAVLSYLGYHYLQRGGSIMGVRYSVRRLDALEAKCLRQSYLEARFPGVAAKGRVNLLLTCLFHGQKALCCLTGPDRALALETLKRVVRQMPVGREERQHLSAAYRIWFRMMRISFEFTCRLRNALKIGV